MLSRRVIKRYRSESRQTEEERGEVESSGSRHVLTLEQKSKLMDERGAAVLSRCYHDQRTSQTFNFRLRLSLCSNETRILQPQGRLMKSPFE